MYIAKLALICIIAFALTMGAQVLAAESTDAKSEATVEKVTLKVTGMT